MARQLYWPSTCLHVTAAFIIFYICFSTLVIRDPGTPWPLLFPDRSSLPIPKMIFPTFPDEPHSPLIHCSVRWPRRTSPIWWLSYPANGADCPPATTLGVTCHGAPLALLRFWGFSTCHCSSVACMFVTLCLSLCNCFSFLPFPLSFQRQTF